MGQADPREGMMWLRKGTELIIRAGTRALSWRQADCCCAEADASLVRPRERAHKLAACGHDEDAGHHRKDAQLS